MLISRQVHGIIDYIFAALLIASPWLFGFSDHAVASRLALAFGGFTVMYSLMTNYELGLLRFVPFAVHRFFDLVIGVMLAGATWHFSLTGRPGLVFTILGILALLVTIFTRRPTQTGTLAQ